MGGCAHHFCGDLLHDFDLKIALGDDLLEPSVELNILTWYAEATLYK